MRRFQHYLIFFPREFYTIYTIHYKHCINLAYNLKSIIYAWLFFNKKSSTYINI